jgi:SAM-dependent methyltransferase
MTMKSENIDYLYPSWMFRREDESPDSEFYAEPRLVVHVDEYAIWDIGQYLGKVLPENGFILDLLSSWRSHLPAGFRSSRVVGLGMNAFEMENNPHLDQYVIHDVNIDPILPFHDATFDAVLLTVSIQYLIKPVQVFREVNRILKPSGGFHVVYSNRMFPTKAVLIWRESDDLGHSRLVSSYLLRSAGWEDIATKYISKPRGFYTDPVYVVAANKVNYG